MSTLSFSSPITLCRGITSLSRHRKRAHARHLRMQSLATFASTTAATLRHGASPAEALDMAAQVVGTLDRVFAADIAAVREQVKDGSSWAEAMTATRAFPDMLVEMVRVGEKTGDLSGMLAKAEDFYHDQIRAFPHQRAGRAVVA